MPRGFFARTDFLLLAVVLSLCVYGGLMICSCTQGQLAMAGDVALQLVWVLLGLAAMLAVMTFDYNRLAGLSPFLYGLAIALLLLVLAIGQTVYGSTRWLILGPIRFQPAEVVKLAVIIMLGTYVASRTAHERRQFDTTAWSLAYVLLPSGLIFLQPDLGTPLVLMFIWFFALFVAGARLTHLGAYVFAFFMLFATAWGANLIRPYHKERLTAFLQPESDPRGGGWQVQQSLIAIGSGHFLGKGLFHGTQSRGEFIAHQQKDFIFTVVGEEWGFVGSMVMLGLLGALLWRALAISWQARDLFGRLLAAGIAAMFLIHITANIGMALGMTPVKGMTLPFVSYGGTSMLVNFIAIGILQNIHMRRRRIAF